MYQDSMNIATSARDKIDTRVSELSVTEQLQLVDDLSSHQRKETSTQFVKTIVQRTCTEIWFATF